MPRKRSRKKGIFFRERVFFDRYRFFFFSWSLSWSRAACFISFFLGRKRVFLFSYFLVFFYKSPPLYCVHPPWLGCWPRHTRIPSIFPSTHFQVRLQVIFSKKVYKNHCLDNLCLIVRYCLSIRLYLRNWVKISLSYTIQQLCWNTLQILSFDNFPLELFDWKGSFVNLICYWSLTSLWN